MVVSVINEGFANQLYRYCSAYAAARRLNTELILIVQSSEAISDPFQLSDLGIICSDVVTSNSQIETIAILNSMCSKYRLVLVKDSDYRSMVMEGNIGDCDGIIMTDHYQDEAFFIDYIEEIKDMLCFEMPSAFLESFSREIEGKRSVGVHIRRGDYTFYSGSVASIDFYKAAMSLYESIYKDGKPEYYVFSDDIEYAKRMLGDNRRIHFVNNLGGFREAVEEFFALSMCRHHILSSVSSFGRLADSIHNTDDRLSIYEAFGNEYMVNVMPHRFFLKPDEVIALAPLYDSMFENESRASFTDKKEGTIIQKCIDSFGITKEEEIQLRFMKVENEMELGHFDIALGQIKKLWEILFQTGSQEENRMHELYFRCLSEKGYEQESLIEAMYLDYSIARKKLSKEQLNRIDRIKSNRCRVVIIPERLFNPMWYEDMVNTGICFERMGYDVFFLFWELVPGMEKYHIFNAKLKTSKTFVKSRGTDTHCKQVDINEKIIQFGSLSGFFKASFNDGKTVFLYKQKEVLEAIENADLKEYVTIYWDNSNIMDSGNFFESGDRITDWVISGEEIEWIMKHSDFCASFVNVDDNKTINLSITAEEKRSSMVDYDMTVSYNIEKALAIIDRLAEEKASSEHFSLSCKPLVSILIPVYNRRKFIEESVNSALHQTYQNIEIIICDNKSTDGTYEFLLEKYGNNSKIILHQNESNGGPVMNWKQCLQRAKGKYVKILWSDDVIAPSFVSKCVDVMEQRDDIAFAYSASVVFRDGRVQVGNRVYSLGETNALYHKTRFIKPSLEGSTTLPVSPGCALFRREDVCIMDDIPNDIGISCRMNGAGIDLLIFLLSLKKRETFYYLGTPLSFFRCHEDSITMTNNLTREYNVARAFFCVNCVDGEPYKEMVKAKIMKDEGITELVEGDLMFNRYAVVV